MASVGSGCDDMPPYVSIQNFTDDWGYELVSFKKNQQNRYLPKFPVDLKLALLYFQFEERRYEGGKTWACTKRTILADEEKGVFHLLHLAYLYNSLYL